MQTDIHIQKQIQEYITCKLSNDQIDKLWANFLEMPEWYNYFITELHLTAIVRNIGTTERGLD